MTPTQVFSWEICKIIKNSLLQNTSRVCFLNLEPEISEGSFIKVFCWRICMETWQLGYNKLSLNSVCIPYLGWYLIFFKVMSWILNTHWSESWSVPLNISSVNVDKSADTWGISSNLQEKSFKLFYTTNIFLNTYRYQKTWLCDISSEYIKRAVA